MSPPVGRSRSRSPVKTDNRIDGEDSRRKDVRRERSRSKDRMKHKSRHRSRSRERYHNMCLLF